MTEEKKAKIPDLYPATKSTSKAALQASLCLSGIELLKAPGPESNYLDWEFVFNQFLLATKVAYVVTSVKISAQPNTWTQDNITVCSVITRTVNAANYQYIRPVCSNAFGMWEALKDTHQDSSSGGCMYWIQKLIQSKMSLNNVNARIK